MVDEPRDVAADRRVTAPPAVDAEDPDASLRQVAFLARLAVAVAHELAGIFDDPLVLIDRFGGEDAEVVDLRAAADNFRKRQRFRHLHALQSARAVRNLSDQLTPPRNANHDDQRRTRRTRRKTIWLCELRVFCVVRRDLFLFLRHARGPG